MVMRVIRFLSGLLLIPLCVAVTQTVISLVRTIEPSSGGLVPAPALALGLGFFLWLALYFTVPRPVRSYVLAHELTHALWGAIMGAKVLDMNVSKDKGNVLLSKSNFLIILAPYFFPLYTAIVVIGYYIISIFHDIEPYFAFWLALVGFTWGFHFTFTITTLLQRQTDIRECGYVFSYAVICLFNVLGIALWIVLVSSCTLGQMLTFLGNDVLQVANVLWKCALCVSRQF